MKFSFLIIIIFSLSACVPEKAEEQKIDSQIQREMDLHRQRMQGFGDMDTPQQDGAFGSK